MVGGRTDCRTLKGGTMRKTSRFMLGLAALVLIALPASQALAGSQNMQGAVFDVGTTVSDPFAGRCAEERIWSVINQTVISGAACPTTGVGSCALGKDVVSGSCRRGWLSNAGNSGRTGYFSHVENMTNHDPAADNYFVYILWDQQKNPGTPNAISYYYAAGQMATALEK